MRQLCLFLSPQRKNRCENNFDLVIVWVHLLLIRCQKNLWSFTNSLLCTSPCRSYTVMLSPYLSVITSGGGTKWYSETARASASWLCMLISTHMQQKTPASYEWWIFTSTQKKLPIAFRMIFGYYTPQICLWVILVLLSLIWCVEWCNVLSFTSPNLTTCKIKMWWQCLLSC